MRQRSAPTNNSDDRCRNDENWLDTQAKPREAQNLPKKCGKKTFQFHYTHPETTFDVRPDHISPRMRFLSLFLRCVVACAIFYGFLRRQRYLRSTAL